MKQQTKFQISEIQKMNFIWVIGSLVLLYYGIIGDIDNLINSFVLILLLFCAMLYFGRKHMLKKYESYVVGEETKGQWDK